MLRVTPIYGSQWCPYGSADEASCTLVEYGDCRVLLNVGYIERAEDFPILPEHDCLLLTDSTLESMGALPLYYEQQQQIHNKNHNNRNHTTTSKTVDHPTQLQQQHNKHNKNPTAATSISETTTAISREPPPIYATFPIVKMGQMTLYDHHANLSLDGGKAPFSLEQIDSAIASIQSIKYSQKVLLTPSSTTTTNATTTNPLTTTTTTSVNTSSSKASSYPTLSVTAHRAGHVVGGSFFVLQRLQDETTVVLTKLYHIAKELHLDSSTLLKHATTPDVLVTYPGGPAMRLFQPLAMTMPQTTASSSLVKKQPPLAPQLVTQVERKLTERVMAVLRRNGHVLIPTDAASRALELVFLFNQHWERHRLKAAYNLVWLGPMVHNTLEFAKSQLEWMSPQLLQTNSGGAGGDNNNNNNNNDPSEGGPRPSGRKYNSKASSSSSDAFFNLQNLLKTIQFCATTQQVEQLMQQNPTCVLATGLSLEHGPARNMLLLLADNPDNAIFFTDSSQAHLRSRASSGEHEKDGAQLPPPLTSAEDNTANVAEGAITAATTSAMVEDQDSDQSNNNNNNNNNNKLQKPDGRSTAAAVTTMTTASPWTTAAQLLRAWCQAKAQGLEDEDMEDSIWIDVPVPKRIPLQGTELAQFLAGEKEARRLQRIREEERAMLREVELAKGQLRLGGGGVGDAGGTTGTGEADLLGGAITASTTDNKTKASATTLSKTTTMTQPLQRPRKKSRFDQTLFLKFSKPLHLSFEVREEAVGIGQNDSIAKFGIGESIGRQGEVLEDDYGIAVLHDRFTDIVSGVDPSKFGASGRVGEDVLRRGFGYAGSTGAGGLSSLSGPKMVSEDEGTDRNGGSGGSGIGGGDGGGESGGPDDLNEQEMEAMDLSEGRGIIRGRHGRPPMKVTTVLRRLEVLAEISYIPLEGRVDARAARQSVRALQPRRVIVLGGPAPPSSTTTTTHATTSSISDPGWMIDSVTLLAQAAQSFVTGTTTTTTVVEEEDTADEDEASKLLTPSNGETVELNVGHAAFAVRLLDTPFYPDAAAAAAAAAEGTNEPVEPYEVKLGACTVSLIDHVFTGQKVALDGSLVLAPRVPPPPANGGGMMMTRPSTYLSAGDVLLTDLRAELIAQGFKADYTSHKGYSQLVVNGRVVVRKEHNNNNTSSSSASAASGRISVEGPLCEDFWTVRQVVCRQYVVL